MPSTILRSGRTRVITAPPLLVPACRSKTGCCAACHDIIPLGNGSCPYLNSLRGPRASRIRTDQDTRFVGLQIRIHEIRVPAAAARFDPHGNFIESRIQSPPSCPRPGHPDPSGPGRPNPDPPPDWSAAPPVVGIGRKEARRGDESGMALARCTRVLAAAFINEEQNITDGGPPRPSQWARCHQ